MTYSNHIIFDGLDDARRHQRGEELEKSPISAWQFHDRAGDRKPHKRQSEVKKPHLSEAERIAIAREDGSIPEISKRHGVSVVTIYKWRKKYAALL